jgi:hypothetical protein
MLVNGRGSGIRKRGRGDREIEEVEGEEGEEGER